MVLVFDLDDTLYDETSYVKSGFKAVADYLYKAYSIPGEESLAFMLKELENGRGRIFDDMLLNFGLYTKKRVNKCLSIYHCHKPDIHLYPETAKCLKRFSGYPLYIVTDGNKTVQKNKLAALGLDEMVKFCFITHRYSIRHAKPSPYCFLKICEREKVAAGKVVYIGDNPHKDFVGIKPFGFKTIRIKKGHYEDIVKSDEFEAEYCMNSISELSLDMLVNIFSN